MPALINAQEAVDSLDKKDIDEMKAMKNLMDIMKAIIDTIVVYLMGKLLPIQTQQVKMNKIDYSILKDSYDEGGKAVLFDMNFLNKLKGFQKESINEEPIELLQPYMAKEWFSEEKAQSALKAAQGLLKCVKAIFQYHEKLKIVKPKRVYLQIQEGCFEVARKELDKAQLIQLKLKNTAKLKEAFNKQMEEKSQLEQKSNKTKKRITPARQLIESLSDEKAR